MRHRHEAGRGGLTTVAVPTEASTEARRSALVARARANGWDVVGHRWVQMTRGTVRVDVWFTDVTGRVVRARCHDADGQIRDLDIVHDRAHRLTLDEVVARWLRAPIVGPELSNRALRSSSAAHSTEFEAIGTPSQSRPGQVRGPVVPTVGRVRVPAWVRTDLSPA